MENIFFKSIAHSGLISAYTPVSFHKTNTARAYFTHKKPALSFMQYHTHHKNESEQVNLMGFAGRYVPNWSSVT